jgi:Cu(I)/Ag(I) efflux system membrane fusion protein
MAIVLVAGAGGSWLGRSGAPDVGEKARTERKVLYWYDPMVPAEHYDNPNSLSSMGMKTVPKYADEEKAGGTTPGSKSTRQPARTSECVVAAEVGSLPSSLTVTGTIDFNQRNVAVIQARAGGFVTRVYGRAPGDVIVAGADRRSPAARMGRRTG